MPPSQFQSTVRLDQGFGVIGEIIFDGPSRVQPFQTDPAAVAANCVIGRMFSLDIASGLAYPGSAGAAWVQGTNEQAGVLCFPKEYVSYGTTSGGTLDPTLLIQPGQIAQFLDMGLIVLLNATAAAPGDSLQYHWTTGVISSVRGAAAANNSLIPNAIVDRVKVTNGGGGLICGRFLR